MKKTQFGKLREMYLFIQSCITSGDSDRPVTADDLSKMSYLTCAMKETLRITPSVPTILRALEEDIELGRS